VDVVASNIIQVHGRLEAKMNQSQPDQELIRQILLKTFPQAKALDEDTLEDIVNQRHQSDHAVDDDDDKALHMDLAGAVDLIRDYMPLIVAAATLVKNYYEIRKLKNDLKAEKPTTQAVAEEVRRRWSGRDVSPDELIVQKITQGAVDLLKRTN
jgi:hypothetical protein